MKANTFASSSLEAAIAAVSTVRAAESLSRQSASVLTAVRCGAVRLLRVFVICAVQCSAPVISNARRGHRFSNPSMNRTSAMTASDMRVERVENETTTANEKK
jgi:hypothetical protein